VKRPEPFSPLQEWARNDLERVRDTVTGTFPAPIRSLLDDRALRFPDGERDPLRPYVLLATARFFGCTGDRAIRMAAALQMIYLASLLHDRLGAFPVPPVSGEGGEEDRHPQEAMDILLGDFLFSRASCLIIEEGDERIVRDMIRTSIASAEVQATLVTLDRDPASFLPSRCFDVVSEKLSLLVSLGLRVGALLGGASDTEREALSDFGSLLGRSLRIVQDLESWTGTADVRPACRGEARFHHPLLLLWERRGRTAWEEAVRELGEGANPVPESLHSRARAAGDLRTSAGRARRYGQEAVSRLEQAEALRAAGDLKALAQDALLCGLDAGGEEVP
jgi:geranylgeranyl pyrophosphate synthase